MLHRRPARRRGRVLLGIGLTVTVLTGLTGLWATAVRVDSGSSAEWRLTRSTAWTYDASYNPTFYLSPGTHTLTVGYREAGAAVDRLVLVRG